MPVDRFDDYCAGCQPAVLDLATNEVLPDTDPTMVLVNQGWADSTLRERQAFHRVTCLNSQDPVDLLTCQGLLAKMGL